MHKRRSKAVARVKRRSKVPLWQFLCDDDFAIALLPKGDLGEKKSV